MNIGIIFGGKSTEHDISLISGSSILYYIDKEKYNVFPIYISKDGEFFEYKVKEYKILKLGEKPKKLKKIKNIIVYFKKMDVIFPILHGKYGEDGTIQGLLDVIGIPYVGPKVLASSLCMDKISTKMMLEHANINVSKYLWVKKDKDNYICIDNIFNIKKLNSDELIKKVKKELKYPVFVKPSNSGSSIGVHKAFECNLINSIEDAFIYDDKVLIEEEIKGRELEIGVIGNNKLITSEVGEVLNEDFYSFDKKYKNDKENTVIPAKIDKKIKEKIENIAKEAYIVCNLKGMARVDFFLEKDNKLIINEINTIPGFTTISMFPKLFEEVGIKYPKLIDELIRCAKEER